MFNYRPGVVKRSRGNQPSSFVLLLAKDISVDLACEKKSLF